LIDTQRDLVKLDGQDIQMAASEPIYLLLNKPPGILCTTCDQRGRRTVIDVLPPAWRECGLYPVGRLDLNSRGLVFLTNDGELAYRLTHPRFEKEKEYLVLLDRPMSDSDRQHFEKGLSLEDGLTHPARISRKGKEQPLYSVIIHEGRKRQLRRMFQSIAYAVRDLQRVRLGSLILGDLKEGVCRKLTAGEIKALKAI